MTFILFWFWHSCSNKQGFLLELAVSCVAAVLSEVKACVVDFTANPIPFIGLLRVAWARGRELLLYAEGGCLGKPISWGTFGRKSVLTCGLLDENSLLLRLFGDRSYGTRLLMSWCWAIRVLHNWSHLVRSPRLYLIRKVALVLIELFAARGRIQSFLLRMHSHRWLTTAQGLLKAFRGALLMSGHLLVSLIKLYLIIPINVLLLFILLWAIIQIAVDSLLFFATGQRRFVDPIQIAQTWVVRIIVLHFIIITFHSSFLNQ